MELVTVVKEEVDSYKTQSSLGLLVSRMGGVWKRLSDYSLSVDSWPSLLNCEPHVEGGRLPQTAFDTPSSHRVSSSAFWGSEESAPRKGFTGRGWYQASVSCKGVIRTHQCHPGQVLLGSDSSQGLLRSAFLVLFAWAIHRKYSC